MFRLPSPPKDRSVRTRRELLFIKGALREPYDVEFHRHADRDLAGLVIKMAGEWDLRFSARGLRKLEKEAASYILSLKHKYNRKRPKHIAKLHGLSLIPRRSISANTPAYPSGHSAQAQILCGVLYRDNPHRKKDLQDLAEKIGYGRVKMGVHYPSDHKAGKLTAHHYLSEMGIEDFVPVKEIDMRKIARDIFHDAFFDELEKIAQLKGMTYDPNNQNIKKLQSTHGANWKNVLAATRGIDPGKIREVRAMSQGRFPGSRKAANRIWDKVGWGKM